MLSGQFERREESLEGRFRFIAGIPSTFPSDNSMKQYPRSPDSQLFREDLKSATLTHTISFVEAVGQDDD